MPFVTTVRADGTVFSSGTGFFLQEKKQYAVILHKNGIQEMLLSINISYKESNSTVWVFPIPTNANLINVNFSDEVPIIYGIQSITDASNALAKGALSSAMWSMMLPFGLMSYLYTWGVITAGGPAPPSGINIIKHLEKYGMTVEVISATNGSGIYKYLVDLNLTISKGTVPQLDNYTKTGFSFVVVWISGRNATAINPGVFVDFPSKDLYYPLCLTSVYGEAIIPTEIIVAGYVSPQIYQGIEQYMDVSYWKWGAIWGTSDMVHSKEYISFEKDFYSVWNNRFTVIDINAPSSRFTEDLWIHVQAPKRIENSETVWTMFNWDNILVTTFYMILIISIISGLAAGILTFGLNKKKRILAGVGIGLLNIIGLMIVIKLIDSRRVGALIEYNKQFKRRFIYSYVAMFVISFVCLYTSFFVNI